MKKFLIIIALLVGCVTPQKSIPEKNFSDFNPMTLDSPEKVAVGKKMVSLHESGAGQNREAMLALYAPNAIIMTGGGKPVRLTKAEYINYLENQKGGPGYEVIFYGYPKIKILGSGKAEAITVNKIRTKSGSKYSVTNKYIFSKINGEWLIVDRSYSSQKLE